MTRKRHVPVPPVTNASEDGINKSTNLDAADRNASVELTASTSEDEEQIPLVDDTQGLKYDDIEISATDYQNTINRMIDIVRANNKLPEFQGVLSIMQRFPCGREVMAIKEVLDRGGETTDSDITSSILSLIPPKGAIFHRDSPCPVVFRQNRMIMIDKVTVNIAQVEADPFFWWQPVDVPLVTAATTDLAKLIRGYNPDTDNYSLGWLKTNIS